jgi:hypothetical protein
MLDQNVPNPLAQNPSFHTHKVFASVGLILIGLIVGIGGTWYFVQSAQDKAPATEDNKVKVSTSSAKTKTETKLTEKDETADWKNHTSTKLGFLIKYPNDWTTATENENGLYLARAADYGEPAVNLNFKVDKVTTDLYNKIKSYTVNKPVKVDTNMETDPGSGQYLQDTYTRLPDSTISGSMGVRYTLDYGYKDVGVGTLYGVFITKGNTTIQVSMTFGPEPYTLESKVTFLDKILTTFKFL